MSFLDDLLGGGESAKKGGNRTGRQQHPGKSHSDREDKPRHGGENHSQRHKSNGSKTGGRGN